MTMGFFLLMWGGWHSSHDDIFKMFDIVDKNDFLNKILTKFYSHHHIFPYYNNFIIHHY
jgi:hypothetical protein